MKECAESLRRRGAAGAVVVGSGKAGGLLYSVSHAACKSAERFCIRSLASKGKDAAGDGELGWKGAYVRFGNMETGMLKLVKGRGKWSPSEATAAAVAEEEDEEEEAEVEEVGEGEDADAPKGKLKELDGDYRFAREQDCDLTFV